MWLTGTKFVLPTHPKWIALLICVGIFGLAGQVRLLRTSPKRDPLGSPCLFADPMYESTYWHLTDLVGDGSAAREGW